MIQNLKERRRAAGEEGFTLIELLVVIIILGILAAVVVFAVGGAGDKGQKAACIIDTRTLRTGLEAHFAQVGTYTTPLPGDATGVAVTPSQPVDENALVAGGFLSEPSGYHSARIEDIDPAVQVGSPPSGYTQGVKVLVADSKCGTLNADVSASSSDTNY